MITTLKITKIIIDHVTKIEVEEPKEILKEALSQRSLTISTVEGERYELILEAEQLTNLELIKPEDWLSPKLYNSRVDDD